jgi:hypothetical protein
MSTVVETVRNSISFTLPSLPGSLNDLYELNRHDSGLPRKRLRSEWALWVTKMMPLVPAFTIQPNSVLRIDRCYCLPWFAKNGRWRKVDVVNMDALLFNLVTRKIGVDDLYVKQGYLDSRNSQENKVEVVITEVTEAEWKFVAEGATTQ